MLIGYARVSTTDQTLDLQKDALQNAGCERIFTDTASGAKSERVGLDEALSYVRPGDTLVVWRLDRLGRSLKHLIETITSLNNHQIGFKSITEAIDTTTSGGKMSSTSSERSPSLSGTSSGSAPKQASPPPAPGAGEADAPKLSPLKKHNNCTLSTRINSSTG